MVEITARLVSDKGAVEARSCFAATAPAKSTEAADAVAALNAAFNDVAKQVVSWTLTTL